MRERVKAALRPWLIRRRFHAFGVGTARSGTHSLSQMFAEPYRAAHELASESLMQVILARHEGSLGDAAVRDRVRAIDRQYMIEMSSSQLNYFVLAELLELFPKAQFVLTVRDCRSWLTSYLDHQLSGPSSPNWLRMRALRFARPNVAHPPQEQPLAQAGLYTLDAYLSYWASHNRRVLSLVPSSRLLVVRTDRISTSQAELARFLRVDAAALKGGGQHSNRAVTSHGLVEQLDRDYLLAAFERHCGELMRELFPDVDLLR